MKNNDPIVMDVRSVREKLFSKHDEDLNKLLDFYHDQEKLDKERIVTMKNKRNDHKTSPGAA